MLFTTNLTLSRNLLPAHASQDSDEKKKSKTDHRPSSLLHKGVTQVITMIRKKMHQTFFPRGAKL